MTAGSGIPSVVAPCPSPVVDPRHPLAFSEPSHDATHNSLDLSIIGVYAAESQLTICHMITGWGAARTEVGCIPSDPPVSGLATSPPAPAEGACKGGCSWSATTPPSCPYPPSLCPDRPFVALRRLSPPRAAGGGSPVGRGSQGQRHPSAPHIATPRGRDCPWP